MRLYTGHLQCPVRKQPTHTTEKSYSIFWILLLTRDVPGIYAPASLSQPLNDETLSVTYFSVCIDVMCNHITSTLSLPQRIRGRSFLKLKFFGLVHIYVHVNIAAYIHMLRYYEGLFFLSKRGNFSCKSIVVYSASCKNSASHVWIIWLHSW